jgi:hypothetical protein
MIFENKCIFQNSNFTNHAFVTYVSSDFHYFETLSDGDFEVQTKKYFKFLNLLFQKTEDEGLDHSRK